MSGVGQAVFMNQRSFILPPVNTVAPSVTGTATVGQTLSTTNGTFTGDTPITFTYQWQRTLSNISGATSSTYTLVGADVDASMSCVVTATNAAGSTSKNSNFTAQVFGIGATLGGGFFAGQIGVGGVATHNLIVGPVSTAQNTSLRWKNANTATPGANNNINGPQNTADIVADGNSTVYPAAHFCNNLSLGGFSDWYLPAKNELEVCYFNGKPTTSNNDTGSGANSNAVPSRASNYTTGNPAQTTAPPFITGGAQAWLSAGPSDQYWTSTDGGSIGNNAIALSATFVNGRQYNGSGKANNQRVRAVRRVAV